MATTGFWPVKGRLKEVIDYAANPDKTTDAKYLDADLYAALRYAENDGKTDERLYVSGVNCSKRNAYTQMMAVKRRFGERGAVVAYHGYQSFVTGKVTPEEAHAIGVETARRMWGDRFQVVVTTHLNTDNLHNHFVVNSVSFKDGLKFRNKIGDHLELRRISDAICQERGKAVLENADFYRHYGKSHREMVAQDVREVLPYCRKMEDLYTRLRAKGYGYKKDPNNREIWYIDEPAAEVVRKIYALCLAGRGPMQIARQLERERILTPTAYYNSIGRAASNPPPADPYRWSDSSIENILANRQYTGCTVNFLSTTVSYKVHKVIYRSPEEQQIIPNTQEAIISEDMWLRVQELRENRRRPTATGRTSLFSGLVFCADCGAKLHFCAAKSLKPNQEHFRCSNYKSGRGTCQVHFIRNVVLERIVFEAVRYLADFVHQYESVFLYLLEKKTAVEQKAEWQKLRRIVENGHKRIRELDMLISRLYEDNIAGKISDERYARMAASYEDEQKQLEKTVADGEQTLREAEQKKVDVQMLLNTLRQCTELKELTPTIVNSLIQRIEVHKSEKPHKHNRVKVDIYFTAVGLIDLPTEQEIVQIMEEMRRNPQNVRLPA